MVEAEYQKRLLPQPHVGRSFEGCGSLVWKTRAARPAEFFDGRTVDIQRRKPHAKSPPETLRFDR